MNLPQFLTPTIVETLLANGRQTQVNDALDPLPVVKLFTPDAGATWLLTELDPEEPDRAFGLCDLGVGCPELGYVSLTELAGVRGRFNLPIERDASFQATAPLSVYADVARVEGRILGCLPDRTDVPDLHNREDR